MDKLFGLAAITGSLLFVFTKAWQAIFDLDIWLHLKTGEIILQNKAIPAYDIFSFTMAGKPWVDHEWLFQVITYLFYARFSADGLIALESYVITLAFLILFFIGIKSTKSYLESAVLLTLPLLISISRFNIRPDIFSLLFFVIYLYALRYVGENKKIWWLLLLQVIWVNLHGYFFLGPLLILLFIFADFLSLRLKKASIQWGANPIFSAAARRRLIKLFYCSIAACFLNPRGGEGALYPVFVLQEIISGRVKVFFSHIQELQPVFRFFHFPMNFYYISLIAGIIAFLVNFRRVKIIDLILFTFFFFFSLKIRNVAFFAFTCYAIITLYIGPYLAELAKKIKTAAVSQQLIYYLTRFLLGLVFIFWVIGEINSVLRQEYFDFDKKEIKSSLEGINYACYPQKAVEFLLANNIHLNILNNFNAGAYLISKAYPQIKVFIDGRTELYGPDFFFDYCKAVDEDDVASFEKIAQQYKIDAVLYSLSSTLPESIANIYRNSQWKLVFFDETGIIFLRDTPANQGLINKYKLDFSKYFIPMAPLKSIGLRPFYPAPYVKRALVLNLLGENDLAIREAKVALLIRPDCFLAYYIIGKAYLDKGLNKEAFENLRCAATLEPARIDALVDLGKSLHALGDEKLALSVLNKAIKRKPRYAQAHYELGCVYLADKTQLKSARDEFNQALKLNRDPYTKNIKLGREINDKLKELGAIEIKN